MTLLTYSVRQIHLTAVKCPLHALRSRTERLTRVHRQLLSGDRRRK